SPYQHNEHVVWLLSKESDWLPAKIHEFLIKGMATWAVWVASPAVMEKKGALSTALHSAVDGKIFRWTKSVRDDALHQFEAALKKLHLSDSPEDILERFRLHQFPKEFVLAQREKSRRPEVHHSREREKLARQ
ncbi:MAG TPA: hypothetical protein PLX89_25180, partial [Verrucomicrobiota bacterium]|nr:hypothetical protein [Verrucomicrobiota bacterium]